MISPTKSSVASISQKSSIDSFDDTSDLPSPLSHQDAVQLAQDMHQGLQPHIKDRMYRFKSYKSCFKHTHAITWAIENIDSDKRIAVQRLNELIDWGLVSHVVDPTKRFRAKETRTLYFRINQSALCEQRECQHERQEVANQCIDANSSTREIRLYSSQIDQMQTKIDGLDHILNETVNELNAANGRLELMHQKVCTLVSQQMSLFGVVSLLAIWNISQMVSSISISNAWFDQHGCFTALLAILLSRCGLRILNSWSLLDNTLIASPEVIQEEETASQYTAPSRVVRTYTKKPSFTKRVSERFGAIVRTKSSKRLSTIGESSVVLARESYSLPDVETWTHRPLLICVNTPVSINLKVPHYGLGPCPLGKPFKFSSDLFEGTCLIRIKDSNSDDTYSDSEYFAGRKRIFQSVVQGRFKEDGLRVSDVLTGHEFSRPLQNLPHPWVLKTASNFIGRVAPGSNVVVHTDQPFVEAILAGTSQAVRGGKFQCLRRPLCIYQSLNTIAVHCILSS